MDKNTAIIILKECFDTEGNCAFLHFTDGSDLLIEKPQQYFDTAMSIESEYTYGDKTVKDVCFIPYSSILYIIVSNKENIRIAQEYNMQQAMMEYKNIEPLKFED